jgi:hypothetical protein
MRMIIRILLLGWTLGCRLEFGMQNTFKIRIKITIEIEKDN